MSTTVRHETAKENGRNEMTLTGPEKAAILILCLGEERGSEMLKNFDEREIQRITRAMSGLGPIHADIAEQVLVEFAQSVNAHTTNSVDAAKSMLLSFLPEDKVASLMKDLESTAREKEFWSELGSVDEKVIAEYLVEEKDQTVAVIVSNLPADVAARVLPLLGEDRWVKVVERMMRLKETPDHILEQIEDALRNDVLASSEDAASSAASQRMADVFNHLDESLFETVSSQLSEKLPDEFAAITDRMFTFRDLIRIESQDLARVMRGVAGNTVPMALKGASEPLKEHFLGALPGRSRDMLLEEMATMGPVRARDVRTAQAELVSCAQQLIEQEVIRLPTEGEDEDEYIE